MNYSVCPICLDSCNDNIHILEPCNHMFHNECIIKSLRINGPSCPVCRGLDNNFNSNDDSNNLNNIVVESTVHNPYYHNNNIHNTTDNTNIYDTTDSTDIYDTGGNNVTNHVIQTSNSWENTNNIVFIPTTLIPPGQILIENIDAYNNETQILGRQ